MPQGTPAWSPAKRGLYLMLKPPPLPLAEVAALSRTSSSRQPDLLHVTLLAFVDLAEWPDDFLPELRLQMKGLYADAFHVHFDHISERKVVALRSSIPHRGVRTFRKQVVNFLVAQGVNDFTVPGNVHLTINYGRDGQGKQPIAPISWMVDEVLLIESLGGESTHIVHERWQLRPLLI